jgi:HAMP domain-containing protein
VQGEFMLPSFLKKCSSSLQLKLFFSLTAVVAVSLVLTLAAQVFLVQDYFVHQAETNLRNSNYLLSRVLADPLYDRDLALLQTRLKTIQARNPLCGMQLKDDSGNIIFKRGLSSARLDSGFNPNSMNGCYTTMLPVVRGEDTIGMLRFGISTEEIANARDDLIQKSVMISVFLFALFLLPFFIQIRRMMQPLNLLSETAVQFSKGNFDHKAPSLLDRNDEVGQLASNFQGMAQSLVKNHDWQVATMATINNEKSVLDTLLATLPVGVFFADHTHVRYCNKSFRKMFMLDPKESLVGMKNDAVVSHIGRSVKDASAYLQTITEILDSRSLTEAKYITLKNGSVLRLSSNVVIAPENRGYLGRFWLFEDVTKESANK